MSCDFANRLHSSNLARHNSWPQQMSSAIRHVRRCNLGTIDCCRKTLLLMMLQCRVRRLLQLNNFADDAAVPADVAPDAIAVRHRVRPDLSSKSTSVKNLKRIVKRNNDKIKHLQHQLTLARQPVGHFRCDFKSQRSQMASSGMLLALLRCSGHGSSKQILTIGNVLAQNGKVPTTRQTLSTWEVATGTTVLSSACKFQEDMEMTMLSPEAVKSGKWMAAGHVVMGDATRSKAWREDKIQPLCLVSWYCAEDAEILSHTAWPDVQVVKS